MLRAREDERVADFAALEQRQQQLGLELLRHRIHRLGDAGRRRRPALEIDRRRIVEHLLRQLRDRRRHRRAEEQRLALLRQMSQHAPDVGQKAHVEHPVGFVEHEKLEPAELRVRRAEVIEQPSGRADEDVDAAAERVFLRPHADAAEDRRRRERRVHGERR